MNKHHALANQGITKTKVFTCFIAVVLAFGLTAMPALAAPESDDAESTITIVAVDNTSEKAEEKAETTKAETPKKDAAATESTAKEPEKSESSSTATDAKKEESASSSATEESEAPAKKELNAAEKAAAVFQGEAKLAVANSTGISAQSSYGSYGTYDTYDDPAGDILDQITGMSSSYTYDIKLDKFMTGPLYTTKDENGNAKEASYTVMFEIEGMESDAAGSAVVYAKRSIGIKVAHDGSGTLELTNLPRGYYTIKEIVGYPGCAYVCTTQNPVSFWIGYEDEQKPNGNTLTYGPKFDENGDKSGIVATATFKNKAEDTQKIFSEGYVNHYAKSGEGIAYEQEK